MYMLAFSGLWQVQLWHSYHRPTRAVGSRSVGSGLGERENQQSLTTTYVGYERNSHRRTVMLYIQYCI